MRQHRLSSQSVQNFRIRCRACPSVKAQLASVRQRRVRAAATTHAGTGSGAGSEIEIAPYACVWQYSSAGVDLALVPASCLQWQASAL